MLRLDLTVKSRMITRELSVELLKQLPVFSGVERFRVLEKTLRVVFASRWVESGPVLGVFRAALFLLEAI